MKFQVLTISVIIDHTLFDDNDYYENRDFKNSLVKNLIHNMENQKLLIQGIKRTYVIYSQKNVTADIVMFKLGKRGVTDLHVEIENDIKLTQTDDTPFVIGFISLSRQAILVGINDRVITKHTVIEIIEKGLNSVQKMSFIDYQFKITALKESRYFWQLIDKNRDYINEIQLDFYPPNFISYNKQIKDQLRETKSQTNNSKLSVIYKNEKGHLLLINHFLVIW